MPSPSLTRPLSALPALPHDVLGGPDDRLRFLTEAGAHLARSLDYEETLRAVARCAVPAVADGCAVDILEPGDEVPHLLAVAHVCAEKAQLAHELRRRYPLHPEHPFGVMRVLRTGRGELLPEITDEMLVQATRDEEHLRLARELGLASAAVVPLVAGGDVLGAITFVSAESGRRFTEADLWTAEQLAARAAVAVQNARLVQQLRRAEQAARASEQRLLVALDAGRLGPWEYDLASGKVSWSPQVETLHGLPVGSFPGTFEAYQRDIHPDDRERVLSSLGQVLEGRREHHLVYRIVRPDGQTRWLEAWGKLLRDEAGRPQRLVGMCTDITERKQNDEAALMRARLATHAQLRAEVSEALSAPGSLDQLLLRSARALAQHLQIPMVRVWTLNRESGSLELQATAGDYEVRIPVGAYQVGMVAEQKRPLLMNDLLSQRNLGDRAWAMKEGICSLAAQPLLAGGELVGVVALFGKAPIPEDTFEALGALGDALAQGIERKRAESALALHAAELQRSNAELQQFAYVASHDLQEPLRMVASYTQLLSRRYKGKLDKDADEFIGYAVDGVTRMKALIEDLLAYSRVGTRGKELKPTETRHAVDRALLNLRAAIEQHGGEVLVGALPTVLGDEGQLAQLFQNLIGNALKFRGEGRPRVEITARRVGWQWELAVKDNGIGIHPDYFDRVFVIFQRLHTREEYPGNGIGLAICKKIIERHGGRIWVESSAGQGSTFRFTLPAPTE